MTEPLLLNLTKEHCVSILCSMLPIDVYISIRMSEHHGEVSDFPVFVCLSVPQGDFGWFQTLLLWRNSSEKLIDCDKTLGSLY